MVLRRVALALLYPTFPDNVLLGRAVYYKDCDRYPILGGFTMYKCEILYICKQSPYRWLLGCNTTCSISVGLFLDLTCVTVFPYR